MRRVLFIVLVAAGCGGGSHQSTTPLAPLPDTKPETAAPAPKPDAEKPAPETAKAPEPPAGPVEITLAAPKATVKLVSAGKGKREALKLTPKAGDKQPVEIAMDFSGKTTAPPELGGTQEQIAPTVVLGGQLETQDVAPDATKFQVTVDNIDAKDVTGSKTPAADFKKNLKSLTGMTIAGSVNPNGTTSDLTLRVEKPDDASKEALGLIHLSLLPMWPVLPTEPIGTGAKWQVTSTSKLADQLDVTQTTDYELVSHKGAAWTIKGTTKITGTDQDISAPKGPKTTIGKIAGTGTTEATISTGSLSPASTQKLETSFEATVVAPGQDGKDQTISLKFELKQGNAVTSSAAPPAAK